MESVRAVVSAVATIRQFELPTIAVDPESLAVRRVASYDHCHRIRHVV